MQNRSGYTRGKGILEPFLADQRAQMANRLIDSKLRSGRILDIGCGSFPYFLSHTSFKEKFAIDQLSPKGGSGNIKWHILDLSGKPELPFEDGFFSVASLLAVVEHLEMDNLPDLLSEVLRTLTENGMMILTTPAAWSDGILRFMAQIGLVSAEEIDEHKSEYTIPQLQKAFVRAGFSSQKLRFGYFEMGLNIWAVARK